MSGPTASDEALVAAFQRSGQRELLDQLIRRHVAKVRAMVYQMVLDDADADDLTQEVFVRAIRGIGGFGGRSRFSTWLHRIALNTVYSFLRQRSQPSTATTDALAERPDRQARRPEAQAMADELDAEISAAMAALPAKLRAALVLTTLQGLSVRDAAAIEGCAAATIYWRVHKARKILRQQLGDHLA